MSKRLTSFADALTVPQLAQACIAQLDGFRIKGKHIALKVLRQLSKEISSSMLTHVKEYSHNLKLGCPDMLEALQSIKFLNRTKLSKLTIKIVDGRGKLSVQKTTDTISDSI